MTGSLDAETRARAGAYARLTLDLLREQLGPAFAALDAHEQARRVALLAQVRDPADVALEARLLGSDRWDVAVCTADTLGALSVIAGLLTAHGLDIERADIATVRLPAADVARTRTALNRRRAPKAVPTPQRRTLDVFRVRAVQPLPSDAWDRFRAELVELFALLAAGEVERARDQVADRVSAAIGPARDDALLAPLHVVTDIDADDAATVLRISGADSTGFLFELANALALLNANIERAEVRTLDGRTDDAFWVTDAHGKKIVDPARLRELRTAVALIKQFTLLLPQSPNPGQALRQFSALTRQLLARPDWTADLRDLESGEVLRTLAALMGVSEFLWEDFLRIQHENLFPLLGDLPALDRRRTRGELERALDERLAAAADPGARRAVLNEFKDRQMFVVDLRHITRRIDFRAFADELSDLAEVVLAGALRLADAPLRVRHGEPLRANGRPCPWVACALGKFGGREMGFASDIELLFVYAEEGDTARPDAIPNARYFEALVRGVLESITARRESIFEIDLRLRPYGNAGALASTRDGFAAYYSARGDAQQFERLALVKLRSVAGDADLGAEVVRLRDAFVYAATPLDLDDVRHLRHRQATELVPAGAVSAKHSAGGLVDIEYFVQTRQIAAGVADATVRVPSTLQAIERLAAGGHLDPPLAAQLAASYAFLRRLIDALRVVRGHARDLTLPPEGSQQFAYLARRLDFASSPALAAAIAEHMGFARRLWD